MHGRLTVLSVIGGIFFLASSALAASGGIGVRLLDVPANSGDPVVRSYIVARLAPGGSLRRRVEISNTTHSAATVSVYVGGANLRGGRFEFVGGRGPLELSTWTSVSRRVLHLAPGGKEVVTVTTRVPEDVIDGERYAVVWAAVSAGAPDAGGMTLVNRVGVRMYMSVARGGPVPSNFVIGALSTARSREGALLVAARVHNTGAHTLNIGGTLTLTGGPGGLRAGPFPVQLDAALEPGAAELARVQLDGRFPRGPWRADVRLSSGRVHRSIAATVTFPAVTPAARAGRRWSPVLLVLPAVLLVAGGGLLLLRLRGRRARATAARARPARERLGPVT
ncbi:MAG: hypothetical protein QOF43_534 [Gaiellaceae bacterium]|nr:hypothetical protein [Gaiellaceae bacterium]